MGDLRAKDSKSQNQDFKSANFQLSKSIYKACKENKKDQHGQGQKCGHDKKKSLKILHFGY